MTLPIESTLLAEFSYELRPVERGMPTAHYMSTSTQIRSAKSLSPRR